MMHGNTTVKFRDGMDWLLKEIDIKWQHIRKQAGRDDQVYMLEHSYKVVEYHAGG